MEINDEICFHTRSNGIRFEIYAGTAGFAFLQNIADGAQPIALFNSLDKSCEVVGNFDIPNHFNETEIDAIGDELSALILNTYTKTKVEALIPNINLTGSQNIDRTSNQCSLTFPIKINDGICFHPRTYGVQFEMYAGTSGFAFLQHQQDGAQPIALLNPLDKSCEFFGDLDVLNFL